MFLSLMLAGVAACGGGGGDTASNANSTAGGNLSSAAIANVAPASAAVAAAADPTPAAGTPAPTGTAAAEPTPPSNTDTVGRERALSAEASLSVVGLSDTPVQARGQALADGRTFYVDSRTGSDTYDGRANAAGPAGSGPWRSLARVMQSNLGAGDTLVLACSSEWRETLRLPASGSAGRPITVSAPAEGCSARPTIDGSVALAPEAWSVHSGRIYKAALDAAVLQLHLGSDALRVAHHPNRGHLSSDVQSPYLALAADSPLVTVNARSVSQTLITGSDLQLPAGARIEPGTRLRLRTNAWWMDESAISAVDGNRLTLSTPTRYPAVAGWGYYLYGALWMLDSASEWHHDAAARQLYAWMPDSQAPSTTVRATVLAVGVDLEAREHVVVDGIVVRRVGTGLVLTRGRGVVLRNSRIEDTAGPGLTAAGSNALTVESNHFARTGADAIDGGGYASAAAQALVVRNNIVRDNAVLMNGEQALSLPTRSYAAILAGDAAQISGNIIVNAGYIGIRVGSASQVSSNFVYGACSQLDDCAGIYTWASSGVVIRSNTVVRMRGTRAGKPAAERASAAQGIYLDESATGALVEDNTVIDADHGLQLHVAQRSTLRGNRLYGNRVSQLWMQETRNSDNPAGDVFGNVIEANQIASVVPGSVGLLLQTKYTSTAGFGSFDRNRYYDRSVPTVALASTAGGWRAHNLAQWRQSRNVGSAQPVDAHGSGVSATRYAAYSISASNLVPNAALTLNTAGWTHWNATAPSGQMIREACAAGTCMRYVAGGSPGLVSTPNFSVTQGQWYRLSIDLATEQDNQTVQLVLRRGGGGSNAYETLSSADLTLTAGRSWARYSMLFQATKTVRANDPSTGDLGARIDIQGIDGGRSVSLANAELVPVQPDAVAQTTAAFMNVSAAEQNLSCPLAASQPALCTSFYRLADDQPVQWPLALAPYSAAIVYLQQPLLIDSDGDGIADAQDRCSGTPAGVPVNASGCAFGQR